MRVTGAYLFGLALTVLGLCPPAAPGQNGDGKAANPFEGTWEVVKLQHAGDDVTPFLKDSSPTMTFKGNGYVFKVGPTTEKGTFTFDAKAKPATIDLKITEGSGKGKTQLGIYEADGDTLRLCMADEGAKDRPTKFASAKDAPEFLLATLKRKKAEK
ncbi:MAG TPA: TIGR03067 domain-containing protein [Urbifossiella sp.]|nr:TIGR03067 domain-containing protein [Urbifossiella sp.]